MALSVPQQVNITKLTQNAEEPSNPEPSENEEHSLDYHIIKSAASNANLKSNRGSKESKRGKQPVDAQELAFKLKQKVKTETNHRLNQLKQKQSDISTKLKARELELRRKSLRDALATNSDISYQSHSPRSPRSVSSRTAELLQQQQALSRTINRKRKHSLTERVVQREAENVEIKWSAPQLEAIDVMSDLLLSEMRPTLQSAAEDVEELQMKQCNFLEHFSKSSIWFDKEQRQRLNAMSRAMNKVPSYRRKLAVMQSKMSDIDDRIQRMKRETVLMKEEMGMQDWIGRRSFSGQWRITSRTFSWWKLWFVVLKAKHPLWFPSLLSFQIFEVSSSDFRKGHRRSHHENFKCRLPSGVSNRLMLNMDKINKMHSGNRTNAKTNSSLRFCEIFKIFENLLDFQDFARTSSFCEIFENLFENLLARSSRICEILWILRDFGEFARSSRFCEILWILRDLLDFARFSRIC